MLACHTGRYTEYNVAQDVSPSLARPLDTAVVSLNAISMVLEFWVTKDENEITRATLLLFQNVPATTS